MKRKIIKYYTDKVAKNKKTDPKILERIIKETMEEGAENSVVWYAIRNPNCPPKILEKILERDIDDYCSFEAVKNINCPPKVLGNILSRNNNDFMSQYASKNPNCPVSALEKRLGRGIDDVLSSIVYNFNEKINQSVKEKWFKIISEKRNRKREQTIILMEFK